MADEKIEEKASGFTGKGWLMVGVGAFVIVYVVLGSALDGFMIGKA